MDALKYWTKAVVTDALLFGAIYASQMHGYGRAEVVAVFWLTVVAVIRLIVGVFGDKSMFEKGPKRPRCFEPYHIVTEIVMISVLAWLGYPWLAATLFIGDRLYAAARVREPKAKAA